jgi:acetate kinase
MMNILILNIGSSSVKYDLFQDESLVHKGVIERVKNYEQGIKQIILETKNRGIEIDAVGHRVVHGGENSDPVIITKEKLKELDRLKELAPLHDVPEIEGIKTCMKLFNVPQIAVFDTAFHQTLPEKAYTYAIPSDVAKKHRIRRYGFHGTSHHYVAEEAAKAMDKPLEKTKIITCHLGNGCSVAAVLGGKSVDTSMGFTPLEGLVMGTRSGDIDPAIIPFLQHKEKYSYKKIEEMLNKQSGLFALCGKTDMRDIHASFETDARARLAEEVFCYRLVKYIGAYIAAMDGVNAIVFTGGIGENAWWIREKVLSHFKHIGVRVNKKANHENHELISAFHSMVWVFCIKTNEELMMAREAKKLLANSSHQ